MKGKIILICHVASDHMHIVFTVFQIFLYFPAAPIFAPLPGNEIMLKARSQSNQNGGLQTNDGCFRVDVLASC